MCYLNLLLRPVELLKHSLEVLHGSICDQHDSLVAEAALAIC